MKTRCRMPGFKGVVCDIRRHLRVRVKRGEPHTNNSEIVCHGKRKFVTSANHPGIRGRKPRARRKNGALCKAICTMLDKHLLRAHQMKIGSVPYKMYMREAKLYMGMMELDEHPRRVLAQAQPSTSAIVKTPPTTTANDRRETVKEKK